MDSTHSVSGGKLGQLTLEMVQELVRIDPLMIRRVDSNAMSLLHRACHEGQLEVVTYLIGSDRFGMDDGVPNEAQSKAIGKLLNLQDIFGRTALMMAVSARHYNIVVSLLSCYHNMSLLAHNPTMNLLKNQDVNIGKCPHLGVNLKDVMGQTALMIAARKAQFPIVRHLLASGANPNEQDDQMRTCLHFLCACPFPPSDKNNYSPGVVQTNSSRKIGDPEFIRNVSECVRVLVSSGIDRSLTDINGNTVFHLCAKKNNVTLLKLILDRGKSLKQLRRGLTKLNLIGQSPVQLATTPEALGLIRTTLECFVFDLLRYQGIENMKVNSVLEWLDLIGFSQYRDVFFQNDVSGSVMLRLTDDALKNDLKIHSLGHRISILNAIQVLYGHFLRSSHLSSRLDDKIPDGDEVVFSSGEQNWEIKMDELQIHEVIGRGFFGEVKRAVWKKLMVAIKTISHHESKLDKNKKGLICKEMAILSQLRHPNILNFFGYVKTPEGDVMMVMELLSTGSLYHLIRSNFDLVVRLRERIVLDIVRGMVYLHSRQIVHRDLNSKNLLLDENYMTKISDFGLSRIKDEANTMSVQVGFLGVMAPEVFLGEKYSESADVFSFAIVLYEILTGKEAHKIEDVPLLAYANIVASRQYRPPWTEKEMSEHFRGWRELVEACWHQDPSERPNFQQILERLPMIMTNQDYVCTTLVIDHGGSYID